MGATATKPFVLDVDKDGRYGTLYLRVPADETFLRAVRALPQVADVRGEHVAIEIEINPVFDTKVLETKLTPLVDALIVRQTELKPYTPGYRFVYTPGDDDKSNYIIYLQTEPDEALIAAIAGDPGTMVSKYEEGTRRFQVVRFMAFPDEEYGPRVKRYLEDFMRRQA